MMEQSSSNYYLSNNLIEISVGYVLAVLSIFTFLTHFSQVAGIAFHVYATSGFIILVVLTLSAIPFVYRRIRLARDRDLRTLLLLFLLGLICSSLALISNRSDTDDYLYVPNVVYALENPREPMGFDVHFLDGGDDCKIVSYSWGTSNPFEYMQGAFAYLFQIDFLSVYYLFTPALIGFLLPFVLYYVFSFFSQRATVTVIGVFFTLGMLLLLGETHHTFGNFSLTRAYQGKTLLLAIGIPYFVGASINFFKTPCPFSWILMFVTATALVGATASTIPVLLALAIVLSVSILISSDIKKQKFKHYLAYFVSAIYVSVYAGFLLLNSAIDLGLDSPVNQSWPTTFYPHLMTFINNGRPITPILVGLSSLMVIGFTSGKRRRFLIVWMAVSVVLFLNPLVAPLVIKSLTSPNIYWRLFYIYPFPLVLGISVIGIIKKIEAFGKVFQFLIASASTILIVGAHFLPCSTSVFLYNTTFFVPPRYKLPIKHMNDAEEIIRYAPEGTMLAPPVLSGIIPMLDSNFPQMVSRGTGVYLWLSNCGKLEYAAPRLGASNFVNGKLKKFPEFQQLMNDESGLIRSIIIKSKMLKDDNVKETLKAHHFTEWVRAGGYHILYRPDE